MKILFNSKPITGGTFRNRAALYDKAVNGTTKPAGSKLTRFVVCGVFLVIAAVVGVIFGR